MRYRFRFLFFSFQFVLASCSPAFKPIGSRFNQSVCPLGAADNLHQDIIGGTPASQNPDWMAFLTAEDDQGEWTCGATLIGSQWALTAAHCTEGADAIKLSLGSLNYDTGETVEVEEFFIHEDYDSDTIENDIALLKLAAPVNYRPIHLSPPALVDAMLTDGDLYDVTLLGWGLTQVGTSRNRDISSELMQASTRMESYADCNAYNEDEGYGALPTSQLCFLASDAQTGSCEGDSGGPAVVYVNGTPFQIGITSWGNETCAPSDPSFYTNVASYLDWIEEKTGISIEEPDLSSDTSPPSPESCF